MSAGPDSGVPSTVRPVDLRDYVDFAPDRANRVRVFATDVLTADLWCLEPRQATPVLQHEGVDVAYTVLGGTGWFVTDEGEVGLGPMGSLLVPAGVAHGIDNRTTDPVIVLAAGSPPDVPTDQLLTDPPTGEDERAVRHPEDHAPISRRLRRLLGGDRGGAGGS